MHLLGREIDPWGAVARGDYVMELHLMYGQARASRGKRGQDEG